MTKFMAKSGWITHLLVLCLFGGCTNNSPTSEIGSELGSLQHFDLKGYFDDEAQRLGYKGKAKKIVVAEGTEETKLLDSVDFKRELSVFSMSDINRPAWSDKYVADSSFNEQKQLAHLKIKSLDESLKTQSIAIDFQQGIVSRVQIQNRTNSAIASSDQTLTYEPDLGYLIESSQKVTFSDTKDFRIQVLFLK